RADAGDRDPAGRGGGGAGARPAASRPLQAGPRPLSPAGEDPALPPRPRRDGAGHLSAVGPRPGEGSADRGGERERGPQCRGTLGVRMNLRILYRNLADRGVLATDSEIAT